MWHIKWIKNHLPEPDLLFCVSFLYCSLLLHSADSSSTFSLTRDPHYSLSHTLHPSPRSLSLIPVSFHPSVPVSPSPSHLHWTRVNAGCGFRRSVPQAPVPEQQLAVWELAKITADPMLTHSVTPPPPLQTLKAFVCERGEDKRGWGEVLVSGCIKKENTLGPWNGTIGCCRLRRVEIMDAYKQHSFLLQTGLVVAFWGVMAVILTAGCNVPRRLKAHGWNNNIFVCCVFCTKAATQKAHA